MSNVGTWMQRVAQDWLVLQLTGFSGAAIGITTGLQFLPFLLLSPFAGAGRRPDPQAPAAPDDQPRHGRARPDARPARASPAPPQIWHVYVLAFVLGTRRRLRRTRPPVVRRPRSCDKDDLTNAVGLNSASFNAARIVGPARRRRPDRRAGRRRRRHGLGDPDQRGQLRRADHDAAQPRRGGPAVAQADGPRAGPDPGRRRLRPRPPGPAAHPRVVFFTGTFGLNFQITSALMATQVFDKGVSGVRPARHVHGRRLAHRLAGRRRPRAGPAPAGDRRGARLRGDRDRVRP